MVKPKMSPKMQKRIPKSRSLWPSMPKKVTWERSGSFKLASPPASGACAQAARALRGSRASAAPPFNRRRAEGRQDVPPNVRRRAALKTNNQSPTNSMIPPSDLAQGAIRRASTGKAKRHFIAGFIGGQERGSRIGVKNAAAFEGD